MTTPTLTERVLRGDLRAVSRAISLIEDDAPEAPALIAALHPYAGRAYRVGITGAPGAGKSTLVDQLVQAYRRGGARIGVLAVDPSSPYTGGALLGDRVRMQGHAQDEQVFIRSMATRGYLGGLARATEDAAAVLDAAGYDPILIETVGVGQAEVEIVRLADAAVVVLAPGNGDEVQTLKAGLMEIADVFVVNKADRDGAERLGAAVEAMLSLGESREARWRPPVVRTVATTGVGVSDLVDAISRFRAATSDTAGDRRQAREAWRLRQIVTRRVLEALEAGPLHEALARVLAREQDPYAAADEVLAVMGLRQAAGQLDHIGIATSSLSESQTFLRDTLGLSAGPPEDVPSQRVRVQFVETGDAAIELIEPCDEASPLSKFLRTRGPGLHHVAIRVTNLDAELDRLKALGVRLIDAEARPGAHGTRVAFIHPAAAQGVLVELVEREVNARAPR